MSFEKRMTNDGKQNPKYIDLLDEDKPISSQKFVCLSFVSPKNIIKQKEMFYFEEFIKNFDLQKSMNKYTQFLNFLSYKYNLNFDKVMGDFKEFADSEKDKLIETTIEDDYKTFLDQNEEKLQKEFNERVSFQTNVEGIKIRGSFPTQEEAEIRSRMLREIDPNHDIYIGQVGVWMPFEPEAYRTGRVEYLEEELNQLMHEKKKNEDRAKQEFEQRLKETKTKAIEENKKLAEKYDNKLTQNVDENGNLIGSGQLSTVEKSLGEQEEITSVDIRKELFESDNIDMSKMD